MTTLYWVPAILTAALIFWLSHLSDLPEPSGWYFSDKVAHALEYGFFMLTLVYGTTRGFEPALRRRSRVVAAFAIATLYGISDEFHQSFTGRDPSAFDWLADVVGALLMALLIAALWRRMAAPQDQL
ncbi:MAG: VanZ family protein [Acidobacteriota bacterium]|jgi:VanZ family protein